MRQVPGQFSMGYFDPRLCSAFEFPYDYLWKTSRAPENDGGNEKIETGRHRAAADSRGGPSETEE
jgi:hypothetical protein